MTSHLTALKLNSKIDNTNHKKEHPLKQEDDDLNQFEIQLKEMNHLDFKSVEVNSENNNNFYDYIIMYVSIFLHKKSLLHFCNRL